jgi:hypothetical protein
VWFGRKPTFIRPILKEVYDLETQETRLESTVDVDTDGHQWVDFMEDDIEYERRALTEAENRVYNYNAHRSTRYGKINAQAPPFAVGDLVTLRCHLRNRISTESTRIPT